MKKEWKHFICPTYHFSDISDKWLVGQVSCAVVWHLTCLIVNYSNILSNTKLLWRKTMCTRKTMKNYVHQENDEWKIMCTRKTMKNCLNSIQHRGIKKDHSLTSFSSVIYCYHGQKLRRHKLYFKITFF